MRLLVIMLVAAMLCAPGTASALSVGIAPPVIDAGDMLPGESRHMEFYIITDHEKDLLVELSKKKPSRSFFDPTKGRFRYSFDAEKASEEDASGWLTLMESSVIVPPEKRLYYLEGGGMANANRKIGVIITVPEDAEPGYHSGVVSPYPSLGAQGGGTALGIISVVEMGYVVNVLGDTRRDAEIAGFSFRKTDPETGSIIVLVKNTGTVTISARADHIRIHDSSNQTLREGKSNDVYISPGEVGKLDMDFSTMNLEGVYGVSAHVEWLTGEDSMDGSVDIGDYVQPPEVTGSAAAPPPQSVAFPLWIIPLLLAGAGILVYWRVR
jgi:archaellum component FlaG (FlaF/FlaG flagellin family)